MKARRIVLYDAADCPLITVDVSDIHHADARAVMSLRVETMCDMGHWHEGQAIQLAPWGRAVSGE